jgi:hypothetical protein
MGEWTRLMWFRIGADVGLCEHGNALSEVIFFFWISFIVLTLISEDGNRAGFRDTVLYSN